MPVGRQFGQLVEQAIHVVRATGHGSSLELVDISPVLAGANVGPVRDTRSRSSRQPARIRWGRSYALPTTSYRSSS